MSEKSKTLKRVRNSALIKNPLLFEAIGLCPVVAIALSLKLALFLAVVTMAEMIICVVLASLLLKNVKRYWRVALYLVFGVVTIFPIMYFTGKFFPEAAINFGVYLPLMAVNSLIALHCERVAVKSDIKKSFTDAVFSSLSYGVVAIIVGFIREIVAKGTVWDIDLNTTVKLPALLMPFGGLLIIGFLAAGLKAFINVRYPDASPDRAFDLSEIRRSHRGSIKDLMNDEFNPYGEENNDEPQKRQQKKFKKKKITFPESEKKVDDKTREVPTLNADGTQRTYLDEFSDILSDLEEYKSRNDNDYGGDAQ